MATLVESKPQLLSILHAHAGSLRALGVRRLGLFGSFVREEPTAESDVDFLVDFEPEKKSYQVLLDLAELLESLLGRRVDLVTPQGLSPYLGPLILREVEDVPLGG